VPRKIENSPSGQIPTTGFSETSQAFGDRAFHGITSHFKHKKCPEMRAFQGIKIPLMVEH
jgi:hypothetical protein